MAAPTIYTGRGYQAPQTRGYAMQALSQFATQEQARKTSELQQGFKERQDFMDLLKTDPVYMASTTAQKRMSDASDAFVNKASLLLKERGGKLTTKDMLELQQQKGAMMAEMQYMKAIDNAMLDARQKANARPDLWDAKKVEEEAQKWMKFGTHDGNFLFPAFQDPYAALVQTANRYKQSPEVSVAHGKGPDGFTKTTITTPQGAFSMDELIAMTAEGPAQYHIQEAFDRPSMTPPSQRQEYLEKAGGNEALAANLLYRDNAMKMGVFDPSTKTETGIRPPVSYDRPRSGDYGPMNGGNVLGSLDGKYVDVMWQDNISPTMLNATSGLSFANESITKPITIDAKYLTFADDVDIPQGTSLKVKPRYGAEGKVEFVIDEPLEQEVTVKTREELPPDKKGAGKSTRVKDAAGNTIGYKYKTKLTGMAATANIDDVMGSLNPFYNGDLRSFWKRHVGEGSSSGSFTIQGEEYTEAELRSGGWSDADIAKLKQQ
jgi:hypothetical protein